MLDTTYAIGRVPRQVTSSYQRRSELLFAKLSAADKLTRFFGSRSFKKQDATYSAVASRSKARGPSEIRVNPEEARQAGAGL